MDEIIVDESLANKVFTVKYVNASWWFRTRPGKLCGRVAMDFEKTLPRRGAKWGKLCAIVCFLPLGLYIFFCTYSIGSGALKPNTRS